MVKPKSITGGVIAAAITPRRSREQSIDLAASLELIDFLYERGVNAIALLGATGEFVHFMLEDRARMLEFAIKRSRLPILANVSHSTLDGAIYLAQEAADSGVAAVLLMPPYFFRYDQDMLAAFCLRFAEAAAKETPVYLYNHPLFSNGLAPETTAALLTSGMFAGIKDSSGDWTSFENILAYKTRNSFHAFMGDDSLFYRAKQAGADGVVSGIASAIPELLVALDRTATNSDQAGAHRLHTLLLEFLECARKFPTPVAIKEAARLRKLKAGVSAVPLSESSQRELERFSGWFKNWLPGVLQECRA